MDKKTIIGFLIILLILFLWPQWNKIFHKEADKPLEPQVEEQAEPVETLDQQQVAQDTVIAPSIETQKPPVVAASPSQPERLVTIETEAKVRVLEVQLSDGSLYILPRANVELMED